VLALGRGNALKLALVVVGIGLAAVPPAASASRSQWSVFEDHRNLVGSGEARRQNTLEQIENLGADTLRIQVRWSDVVPSRSARNKPAFDASNPAAYPGFTPYDDLIRRATARGFRIIVTIGGDAPRWASAGGRSTSFANANYKPSPGEYALYAGAVAARYSGRFGGLPAVRYFTIWNEPNHEQFMKPLSAAPGVYRQMVWQAVPAIRRAAASGTKVFVGETAPVGRAGRVTGPKAFLRRWLCLNKRLRAVRSGSCRGFKRIDASGYAHHPYGPVFRVPRGKDIINMLAIRTLGTYLDRAASAGRLRRHLPIYNTEFGLQTNPPDRSVSTTPSRQARLLNEKEEYSYRYSRLKSYSQYLLYDDRALSAFQTALRFFSGRAKPSLNAYRFPIVVHRRGRRGARIWGLVRPGTGKRFVQLYKGGRRSGGRISTGSSGYFAALRARKGSYFFKAYGRNSAGRLVLLGRSRTAAPIG
jgi:Cellulase (glycosyl hydrolase family 5)